jgi:hypothetical protein
VNLARVQLVLADGIGPDQERALAAVMLGLVVFAAAFLLVERQRSRRRREARKDGPADKAGVWGPKTGASTLTPDRAPVQRYEGPTLTPNRTPDPRAVEPEPLSASAPAADDASVLATPSSPDEIGIVMPEHEPPHAPQEPPPDS